ncbi:MAG: hypothetical protein HOP29_18785 [Phycisphaerales bacterium]|nr:hypothetical protein [Phycisphaerales bacterium]
MNHCQSRMGIALVTSFAFASTASAAEYTLITGIDPLLMPGGSRLVAPSPGPGFPGTFADGNRLAGTSESEAPATYEGAGTPLFDPNEFGALSFTLRRGSAPAGGPNRVPIMGIDFLGGPKLDLDGNTANGTRSLVPVTGQPAVAIPGSNSTINLSVDLTASTIVLTRFDATGSNVSNAGLQPEIATTINVLAGTQSDAQPGNSINPTVDTRVGQLVPFAGVSSLSGVYQIQNLGFEIWQDSVDPTSGTAAQLGSFQFLGTFRGWLVIADQNGDFPILAGEGLGTTLWPTVNNAANGMSYATANGLAGGSATIDNGPAGDVFTAAGNGGIAFTDAGGDLGAYFDTVVVPALPASAQTFIYLESAGFGVNNSADPVFRDSSGYDVVIVASSTCAAGSFCERTIPAAGTVGWTALAGVLLAGGIVAVTRRRTSVAA